MTTLEYFITASKLFGDEGGNNEPISRQADKHILKYNYQMTLLSPTKLSKIDVLFISVHCGLIYGFAHDL